MDYQFVILIILVVVLIFLFIKEVAAIKEEINMSMKKTSNLITTLDRKIDMGFNNCVSKIKVITSDYLVQVRNMNKIESQMIVPTTSNGYSESESIKNTNHKIVYLSDDGANVKKVTGNTEKSAEKSAKKNEFQIDYSNIKNSPKQEEKESEHNIKVSSTKEVLRDSVKSGGAQHAYNESCDEQIDDDDDTSSDASEEDASEEDASEDDASIDISIGSNEIDVGGERSSSSVSLGSARRKPVEQDVDSEHESVVTNDLNLTIETLKPLDQYKKVFLDKIAKKYSIPTTIKDGNVRRPYKKEELYEKIKEKLENLG